ncbi:hypothetical protein FACS189472_05850 [Alphaproteobacteria bacterium]|nr:hypothetical protein FACS189472_05850 [Alphaproteobacteria bacterium]
MFRSGFNLCSIGYDVLFPDGIPITEGKKLRFGGVGKEIRDKIFDSRNTVGFSFSRILSKYNIKITDEFTVMMAIGETIISQAKIVNVESNGAKNIRQSNSESGYNSRGTSSSLVPANQSNEDDDQDDEVDELEEV